MILASLEDARTEALEELRQVVDALIDAGGMDDETMGQAAEAESILVYAEDAEDEA